MTLGTSIIITSVTLALLQYFENSSQDRVLRARQRLRSEFADVLKALDALTANHPEPTATTMRERYDKLVNFNAKGAGVLLIALFIVFGLVVLLHAVHTFASLDDLAEAFRNNIANVFSYVRIVLDVCLVAIVGVAGVHLYRKNRIMADYQRDVEEAIKTAKTAVSLAEAAVRRGKNQE